MTKVYFHNPPSNTTGTQPLSLSLSKHKHSLSLSLCLTQQTHSLTHSLSLSLSLTVIISMASNRDREEALTFTNPSSPITVSESLDSYLTDPNSLIGSASGSFQNEGLLSGGADTTVSDAEFGFSRLDFRTSQLAGSVEFYQRHVFLCHKNPKVWPPRIEASEFDRVPRLLSAAVMAKKADDMNKEVSHCWVFCGFFSLDFVNWKWDFLCEFLGFCSKCWCGFIINLVTWNGFVWFLVCEGLIWAKRWITCELK